MIAQVDVKPVPRFRIVQALMNVRHKWEEAARGDSVTEIDGKVGFILFDIGVALGLCQEEMQLALGDLADEVKSL